MWNSVYKLRRAAQLIAPAADFAWLAEIEKDIALVMVPRSKADRLVLTERLVEAGLTLIQEAETVRQDGFGARRWRAQRIAHRAAGSPSHSDQELCRAHHRGHIRQHRRPMVAARPIR